MTHTDIIVTERRFQKVDSKMFTTKYHMRSFKKFNDQKFYIQNRKDMNIIQYYPRDKSYYLFRKDILAKLKDPKVHISGE